MRHFLTARRLLVVFVLALPIGYRGAVILATPHVQPTVDAKMAEAGQHLFVHEWMPSDPLAGGGDGLGPVFNAASCVACHNQGGSGGGGPLENNVTTFVVRSSAPGKAVQQGVVHGFATDDAFQEKLASLGFGLPPIVRPQLSDLRSAPVQGCVAPSSPSQDNINLSQRNTPALFGAQLLDALPDRVIVANERKQRLKWGFADSKTEQFPVGRALRLADGRLGKFGWKAQTASVSDFVRAACANELGLGNPSQAQPVSLSKKDYRAPSLDLTNEQCDQITAFVASLPRPTQATAAAASPNSDANSGGKLFHATGCAECHTPRLGDIDGVYSDLLLHRMGRDLVGGGSYGDPPHEEPDLIQGDAPDPSESRTPPLWGVADSAPYLHDGRAATLADAIGFHGGQGALSKERFNSLSPADKGNLLAFLNTLRAPHHEKKTGTVDE